MFWFKVADWKSHKTREIKKFPWTRPQGREIEGEARRIITTTAQRNKGYHRGKFNKPVVQVKESIPEGSAEHPTFWTIIKGKIYGRVVDYFHGRRCQENSPPSWWCYCHHIAYCWLHNQKSISRQWKFGGYFILSTFSIDEVRTRPAPSSKLPPSRLWWNEGVACWHSYIICGGGSISATGNQRCEFPCGRLFVLLQCHNWKTNFK